MSDGNIFIGVHKKKMCNEHSGDTSFSIELAQFGYPGEELVCPAFKTRAVAEAFFKDNAAYKILELPVITLPETEYL